LPQLVLIVAPCFAKAIFSREGFVTSKLSGSYRLAMAHGKRLALECSHQGRSKRRPSQERWVVTKHSLDSRPSIISVTNFPHRAVGSSVKGEVISLSSSSSPNEESKAGPCGDKPVSLVLPAGTIGTPVIVECPVMVVRLVRAGPQPGHVILCRRVVASSSPAPHVSSCEVRSLALPLLVMVELRGRLEASRSAIQTSNACVAGLQARLAIMEAQAARTPLTLLLNPFLPLGGAETYVSLYLLNKEGGQVGITVSGSRFGDPEHPCTCSNSHAAPARHSGPRLERHGPWHPPWGCYCPGRRPISQWVSLHALAMPSQDALSVVFENLSRGTTRPPVRWPTPY
jgi:hypothetical protein